MNNFFIITGGPGVGKTTLLEQLAKEGYKYIPEAAREIIKNQIEINGDALPWKNKKLYTDLMLEKSIQSYLETIENYISNEIIFFDRGIPDTICYAQMTGIEIADRTNEIIKKCIYNKKVFILPPWQEIYKIDNERKQTWEEAVLTYNTMKKVYREYNYSIIEVPKISVEERVKFILENL